MAESGRAHKRHRTESETVVAAGSIVSYICMLAWRPFFVLLGGAALAAVHVAYVNAQVAEADPFPPAPCVPEGIVRVHVHVV